jgi:hypothetical protein
MKTVKEGSGLTDISVCTLHYYGDSGRYREGAWKVLEG